MEIVLVPIVLVLIVIAVIILRGRGEVAYKARPLMNRSELRLHGIIDRWRRENARDLVLSVQVPYGSFIGAPGDHWRAIASKRADFVLWARDGWVRAIIEFDGDGHHGNSAADARKVRERDAIKNAAALAANIPLIRIPQRASEAEIAGALASVLQKPAYISVVKAQSDRVLRDRK